MITTMDLLVIGFIGAGICFMGILTNICFVIYEELRKKGVYEDD